MLIETWIAFIAASSIMLLIPGPTILTVISYASKSGKASILALVAAVCLGDLSLIALSIVGLSTLLAVSSTAYNIIKIIGGLYILYLGFGMLWSAFKAQRNSALTSENTANLEILNTTPKHINNRRVFLNTYLVTALNPKGILFFSAFLPQFINHNSDLSIQLFILTISFVCLAA